jgi:hypothetical protein
LENAFKVERNVESKNMAMATRRTNPNIYRDNNAPSSKTPQHKVDTSTIGKEKKKVYSLIVTASTVRDISVVRRNYSTYIVKRKKNKNKNHLKLKTYKKFCLKS